MAIQLTCACGKRFRAPDAYAGKKARCAAALASFGWLAWQIEAIWRLYGDAEEEPEAAAAAAD